MKKLNLILFSALIFFFTLYNSAFSETKIITYNASEIIVTDGDSLRFGKERIRLFGIDAPELNQMCKDEFNENYFCGEEAKKRLNRWILFASHSKKKIYCYYYERDKYNRILGECFLGNPGETKININFFMVLEGYAVAYLKYSDKYSEEQKTAKALKLGLWQGDFDTPEEWRKKNR